ncbi:MAG: SDR family oxidoreductase [Christensenella sp.]|uniref:glucose 1-dehydrogenase n=1 Tax=Christensenella sp. TaxID=1935934 RepID=UPI002B1F8E75|nr:glucose 1-dehydrogenase [Christensenella sp.]MEA5003472.1 SDR family oxidoreductase [Christensenella sp.]
MLEKFSLEGKKAFVTGAAQGIGEVVALGFADAGADVAIIDMNQELAEQVVQKIKDKGRDAIAVKCDVTSPQDVDAMMDKVLEHFGEINIAYNNAGIVTYKGQFFTAEEMPFEAWKNVLDVNLDGVFLCAQAAGKAMIKQKKGGAIINTASMSAHIVNHPQTYCNYNTSKAAVWMLTKCLAMEWAKYDIRVNSISPGYVNTPLAKYADKDKLEYWCDITPMKRLAEPEEMVGMCVYLASDAASYTTGADMRVDGGYTIW